MRPGRTALLVLALGLTAPQAEYARAADSLGQVERAFKRAIDKVLPATVVCIAPGAHPATTGSSGVIVSRDGLVLSDGDVGTSLRPTKKGLARSVMDTIEVRLPNPTQGGFTTYRAQVLFRDRELDTSLVRIEDPPRGGFPDFLRTAPSEPLQVGSFVFTAGNAFGMADETPPTLTAGVVAALPRLPAGGGDEGPYAQIYTSAAVNPGVNGGPVVDVNGYLVGTVSSYVNPGPNEPFQFLGRVVPMDRIRHALAEQPEAREIFSRRSLPTASGVAAAHDLQRAFHDTACEAYRAVVSLAIDRDAEVRYQLPVAGKMMQLPRYQGPVSGVVVSREGLVVTSLYNLTNLSPLVYPQWDRAAPPEAKVGAGVAAVKAILAYLPGGKTAPYELVAFHEGVGIALLRPAKAAAADVARHLAAAGAPLPVAPPDAFVEGRFVLAVANPFGAAAPPDPLLTTGILSKVHSPSGGQRWSGLWQTDAGVTDGNCGGAAVDLRGRLLGLLTIWDPVRHGRNSGVGFVVPWPQIEAVLPELTAGRTFARPLIGVLWDLTPDADGAVDAAAAAPRVKDVAEGSAAATAGLQAGDVILALDGKPMPNIGACSLFLSGKWSGDGIVVQVRRGEETKDVPLVLGARP